MITRSQKFSPGDKIRFSIDAPNIGGEPIEMSMPTSGTATIEKAVQFGKYYVVDDQGNRRLIDESWIVETSRARAVREKNDHEFMVRASMANGSEHKSQGTYNWALFAPGEAAQAFRGSPTFSGWTLVWWYPDKDTVLRVYSSEEEARNAVKSEDPAYPVEDELRDPSTSKEPGGRPRGAGLRPRMAVVDESALGKRVRVVAPGDPGDGRIGVARTLEDNSFRVEFPGEEGDLPSYLFDELELVKEGSRSVGALLRHARRLELRLSDGRGMGGPMQTVTWEGQTDEVPELWLSGYADTLLRNGTAADVQDAYAKAVKHWFEQESMEREFNEQAARKKHAHVEEKTAQKSNEEIAREFKDFLNSERGWAIGSPPAALKLFVEYNYPDKQEEYEAILYAFERSLGVDRGVEGHRIAQYLRDRFGEPAVQKLAEQISAALKADESGFLAIETLSEQFVEHDDETLEAALQYGESKGWFKSMQRYNFPGVGITASYSRS
jgi:hypothetical protein